MLGFLQPEHNLNKVGVHLGLLEPVSAHRSPIEQCCSVTSIIMNTVPVVATSLSSRQHPPEEWMLRPTLASVSTMSLSWVLEFITPSPIL
jgi:hypothetical protein